MGLIQPVPSFAQGYATHQACVAPWAWKGVMAAYASFLGVQGNKLYDFGGLGNHGTLIGPTWVPGKNGWALDFDGSSWVSIADSDSLSFGDASNDSPFSISADINMDDASGFQIFSKGSLSNREYSLRTKGTGVLVFNLYDATATNRIGRECLTALTGFEGTRIHVVGTYDGSASSSGIRLYLNGNRVDNADDKAGSYTAMHNFSQAAAIGRFLTDSTGYSNGRKNEVCIYNRALSAAEIAWLYSNPYAMFQRQISPAMFFAPSVGRISRYHGLNGLGSQGQMTWNPLG